MVNWRVLRLTWQEENPYCACQWDPAISEFVSLSKCTQAFFISLSLGYTMLGSCPSRQLNVLVFCLKRGLVLTVISFPGKCSMWWGFNPPCSLVKIYALSMLSTRAYTQNVDVVKMH